MQILVLWTILYGAGAALLGVGLIVSWSRGAWMGFVAAAMMMLLFASRRLWIGITLVSLLLGGGILAVVTGLAPQSLVARFSDFTQELTAYDDVRGIAINDANYAVVERIAHWQAAVGMATDHPWFGVGFGAYEAAYPQYALMNWPMALGHAHNYYLTVLAETGVVGFVGYIVAWGLIFALTLRLLYLESGFTRGVVLGLLGVWTHFSVHNFFDNLYVNNMFLHLGAMLGLIGGLLLRHHLVTRERNNLARQ